MYKKETEVDEPVSKGEVKRGTTLIHPVIWGSTDSEFIVIIVTAEYSSLWHYEEDFFDSSINEGGGI